MAAGSTEAFTSSAAAIACFPDDILKSSSDKFWAGEVVATASTGTFWEDDPEEDVKRRVDELKRKFHQGRTILIKHLPRDATEEEIRELLSDFPVQSVLMVGSGSGSGMARVVLEDPEMLEDWDKERIFLFRNQRLPVMPSPTEMMLCVARLPLAYTEEQFSCLVCCFGDVRRSFLMISEKTGESKAYGFVEYTTKESALHAKNMLDGKQIENWVLCCDWLDSSHVTFESLHSKCLCVDQLPQDFRDMGEFRKVFSSVVNPPYCQIALKNGCPQNWGLVEYKCACDAEQAQVSLNGYHLKGQSIRIAYYIPGVRAINLYLKLLNDSGGKGKSALLPDPPAPAVFKQLQNLAKQNPIFAQNLQYIILTQILNLQSKNNGCDTQMKEEVASKKSTIGASGSCVGRSPLEAGGQSVVDECWQLPIGDNTRAALVILLAAQMQVQMGNNNPSLLGNPQMLATLQSLLKHSRCGGSEAASTHFARPFEHRPQAQQVSSKKGFLTGVQKVPLLPNPPPPNTNRTLEEPLAGGPPFTSPPPKEVITPVLAHDPLPPKIQDIATFWNGLLGQLQHQNKSSPDMTSMPVCKKAMHDAQRMGFHPENLLLGEELQRVTFPLPSPHGKVPPLPQSHGLESEPPLPFLDASGDLQQTLATLLDNAHNLNRLLGNLTDVIQCMPGPSQGLLPTSPLAHHSYPFMGPQQPLAAPSHSLVRGATILPPQGHGPPSTHPWLHVAPPTVPTSQCSLTGRGGGDLDGHTPPMAPPLGRPILAPPMRQRGSSIFPAHHVGQGMPEPMGFLGMKCGGIGPGWTTGGGIAGEGPFLSSPSGSQLRALDSPPRGMISGIWTHPATSLVSPSPTAGLVSTPGQKRKYDHLLPSPEPSPEGSYIGQHSQGLGGHYVDSYLKRKKKN